MAHRYRVERIEVLTGTDGVPAVFRWRGRRYAVTGVIAHWVEAVPWWRGETLDAGAGGQRMVWRVEAAERAGSRGVYELGREPLEGGSGSVSDAWRLVRVLD
jgi:hypothetical protein